MSLISEWSGESLGLIGTVRYDEELGYLGTKPHT